MQVVILAGGKGDRIKPVTLATPKPMVTIHNKPFLQYQIELLKASGLNQFLLLVGYLGDHIQNYFGNGLNLGVEIKYSYEKELLGTGGALKNAEDNLPGEFLLLNGDTYLPIDYNMLIEQFCLRKMLGMVVAYKNFEEKIPSNIRIDDSECIVSYNKNNSKGMTHIDAGAMILKKEVLNIIPENTVYSLEEKLFPELITMRELVVFPVEQRFYDMGTPDGLRELEGILR